VHTSSDVAIWEVSLYPEEETFVESLWSVFALDTMALSIYKDLRLVFSYSLFYTHSLHANALYDACSRWNTDDGKVKLFPCLTN
jgi:hypothetical protein